MCLLSSISDCIPEKLFQYYFCQCRCAQPKCTTVYSNWTESRKCLCVPPHGSDTKGMGRSSRGTGGHYREERYCFISLYKVKCFVLHVMDYNCLSDLRSARPQPTSRPVVPQEEVQARSVLLSWEPGSDGLSPIRYYTVQYRELPDSNWTVHSASVNHEATSYVIDK